MQISRLLWQEHQDSERMKRRARNPPREMKKGSLDPLARRHSLRPLFVLLALLGA